MIDIDTASLAVASSRLIGDAARFINATDVAASHSPGRRSGRPLWIQRITRGHDAALRASAVFQTATDPSLKDESIRNGSQTMSRLIVPLPADMKLDQDASLIDNFFDSVYSYISINIFGKSISIADFNCPEVEVAWALRYEGEVNNGGHIQFIRNLNDSVDHYRATALGLTHLQAVKHTSIFLDVMEWRNSNRHIVQDFLNKTDPYVGPHREFFDRCDDSFYDERDEKIENLAAKWIRSSAKITIMPVEEYLEYKNGKRSFILYED